MSIPGRVSVCSFGQRALASRHGQQTNRLCRWEKLNLVRVYTKPKGKMPDYSSPVVLRANKCTVEDFVSSPPFSVFTPETQADQHPNNSVTPSIGPSSSSSRAPSSMASLSSTNRNESASPTSLRTKTSVSLLPTPPPLLHPPPSITAVTSLPRFSPRSRDMMSPR